MAENSEKTKLILKIAYRNPKPPASSQITTTFFRSSIEQGDYIYSQVRPEEAAAVYIYGKGVSSQAMAEVIEKSEMTISERVFFEKTNNLVKLLEASDKSLTRGLRDLNSNPNEISLIKSIPPNEPKNNFISFDADKGVPRLSPENFDLDKTPTTSQTVASMTLNEKVKRALEYGKESGIYNQEFYQPYEKPYSPPTIAATTQPAQPTTPGAPASKPIVTQPKHERPVIPQTPFKSTTAFPQSAVRTATNAAGKAVKGLLNTVGNAIAPGVGTIAANITNPRELLGTVKKYTLIAIALIGGFVSWMAMNLFVFFVEIVVVLIGLLTLTIIIIFIINTSAYVVPPGGFEALPPGPGPVADECPSIWPFISGSGRISQGAYANACSHVNLEATDYAISSGTRVVAGHNGRVIRSASDPQLGNVIYIQSTCQGLSFYSIYAHLSTRAVNVPANVNRGQVIGTSGNTGSASYGAHLHYGFYYADGRPTGARDSTFNRHPPYMSSPYLPTVVLRGCCDDTTSCGIWVTN